MRTLSKVNRIGSLVNDVTIGPNSTYVDEVNEIEKSLRKDDLNTHLMKSDLSITKEQDNDEMQKDNVSFAAKALHEMDNVRHLKVTVRESDEITPSFSPYL